MPGQHTPLTDAERETIIDQAIILIEQVYVHLPLKRAMHAVEPLQRLKLLRHNHPRLQESDFHYELVSIFTCLRDRHTSYILPDFYHGYYAMLPFRIQEFYEGEERRYVVSDVMVTLQNKHFRKGVVVTHWNGVPVRAAIELNADREEGSNQDARFARGLAAMTIRPLGYTRRPNEKFVLVGYLDLKGNERESRFEWEYRESKFDGPSPLSVPSSEQALALGLDSKSEFERKVRIALFSSISEPVKAAAVTPDLLKTTLGLTDEQVKLYFQKNSHLPDNFSFDTKETPHGTFGYVRIYSFNIPSDAAFVREFVRILGLLPQDGLIIDVRGNAGGNIVAGERLLQLLTPRQIEPERFHFINSPATLKICNREENGTMTRWKKSIEEAVKTGAPFSSGFPLLSARQYNDIGQKYYGPVVLITDALSYSTADIFVAGFKDHGIGRVVGVHSSTGAGGANVWHHENLLEYLPPGPDSPFKPLPGKASFRVAARRSTRVGESAGDLIEDLGVEPDEVYRMSKRDVLEGNLDLIEHVAKMLSTMKRQSLSVRVEEADGGGREVVATTKNITRLDILTDGRPRTSLDVNDDSPARYPLPAGAKSLELRGFRREEGGPEPADELVAVVLRGIP